MKGYKRSNDKVIHPLYLFGVFYALQKQITAHNTSLHLGCARQNMRNQRSTALQGTKRR